MPLPSYYYYRRHHEWTVCVGESNIRGGGGKEGGTCLQVPEELVTGACKW